MALSFHTPCCSPLPPPHPMSALRKAPHTGTCQSCGGTTSYVCSACTGGAYYCSPQHILEHWPVHREHCDGTRIITPEWASNYSTDVAGDGASDASASDEPSPVTDKVDPYDEFLVASVGHHIRTVRGLYADPLKDRLSFVDIPVIPTDIDRAEVGTVWVAFLPQYLEDPAARTIVTFGDDLQPLSSSFGIYFSVDEYLHKRMVNSAIGALTRDYHPCPLPWYGPVVVMKVVGDPVYDFEDIGLHDLHDVRAYFGRNRCR
ncbi:hypothetical protein C8T65DRAFT_700496 [Cerioporus squamosus]|nr:hypothetical protein C8T65DRAFT_700496 [Cerioporus squamosus]